MNPSIGSLQNRLTPAIKFLLAAIFVTFVCQLSFAQFGGISLEPIFGFSPMAFFGGRFWQLLTYSFLHGGPFHILFNCLTLYLVGPELEIRWGTKRFLRYYTVCALGGALLQTLCWLVARVLLPAKADALGAVPIIGASGAIFGLFVAFGYLYRDTYLLVFFVFPMKARHFVTLLFCIELISAVFYSDSATGGGVAHLVHLGGLITGFLYLRWKGQNLDGHGGGFFPKKKSMGREEVRRRLSLIVNKDPKVGDKSYPITWN